MALSFQINQRQQVPATRVWVVSFRLALDDRSQIPQRAAA